MAFRPELYFCFVRFESIVDLDGKNDESIRCVKDEFPTELNILRHIDFLTCHLLKLYTDFLIFILRAFVPFFGLSLKQMTSNFQIVDLL